MPCRAYNDRYNCEQPWSLCGVVHPSGGELHDLSANNGLA